MSTRNRGIAYMLGFAFLWAIVEMMGAVLLSRYSAFQVVWTRYLVHLLLMLALFGRSDPGRLVRTGRPVFQFLRSMTMLIMPASWVLATRLDAGDVVYAGFWSAPLLIVALSAVFLGERAPWQIWLAAAVGGLAAAAIFAGIPVPSGAQWIPLIGMTGSFSLYVVMTRALHGESTRANLFHTALGVFLALTPTMPLVWQTPALADLPLFLGVGGVGLVVLWMLDRSSANVPVGETAPLILAQVPFALSLAWIAGETYFDRRTLVYLATIALASSIPLIWPRFGFSARVDQ